MMSARLADRACSAPQSAHPRLAGAPAPGRAPHVLPDAMMAWQGVRSELGEPGELGVLGELGERCGLDELCEFCVSTSDTLQPCH